MTVLTYTPGVIIDPDRVRADEAFRRAIHEGRLCASESHPLYAGDYMFMGEHKGRDLFKHRMTRKYLD
jgi:hypothetical protein